MGEFEDLIERAKSGDETALDELGQNFGGSALREKAEQADEWEKRYTKALPTLRQNRVTELVSKLDSDLQETGLTAEDFADIDPESLSLEQVRDAAQAKSEAVQAQGKAAAEAAGFETVEEYQDALATVKKQTETRKAGMENVATGVTSTGGDPGSGGEKTRFDQSTDAHKAAKEDGRADDVAMASFVDVMLDHQVAERESENQ